MASDARDEITRFVVAERDGGLSDEGFTDLLLNRLTAAGYLVVHPTSALPDCPDPWTCCIHTPPKEDQTNAPE